MKTTIYQNTDGIDCVAWTDENGRENSMLKSTYDEQQKALSTPMVIDDPKS